MSTGISAKPRRQPAWGTWAAIAAVFLCVFGLLFASSMPRGMNHDEHQFLAPGVLLATEGLQPYRDYILFHLPNQVLFHAFLFLWTDEYLLAGKLLAVVCGAGIAAAVFLTGFRNPAGGELRLRWLTALTALAFLLFDPLFCFTTGKTWNQDTSTFLAVAAFLLQLGGVRRKSLLLCCLAGVVAAVSVGTRLTLAPLAAALAAFPLFFQLSWRQRFALIACYGCGALAGIAPTLWYFATAPEPFIFGNFEAPRLRLLDSADARAQKTIVWWRKIRFFVKEVMLPSWPLFLSFFAFAVAPAVKWLRRDGQGSVACLLTVCSLAFIVFGCFAPARYQYQHLFAVIPFVVLAAIYGAATLNLQNVRVRRFAAAGSLLAALTVLLNVRFYFDAAEAFDRSEWTATRLHEAGAEIRALAPAGKVLTLAPMLPLAGGLQVYPELAIGVFAWRLAHLLPAERREQMHIIAPDDLERFLATSPPAAILTGVEEKKGEGASDEQPLIDYAVQHQFRPVKLKKRRTLWLPPANFPPR